MYINPISFFQVSFNKNNLTAKNTTMPLLKTLQSDTVSFKGNSEDFENPQVFNETDFRNSLEYYNDVYKDGILIDKERFTPQEKEDVIKAIKDFKTDGDKNYFWTRLMSIKHYDAYPNVYHDAENIVEVLKLMSGRPLEEQLAMDAMLSWEDLHKDTSLIGADLLRFGNYHNNFQEFLDVMVKLDKKLQKQGFPLDDRGQCIGDTIYFCQDNGYKYLPLWDKLSEKLKDLIDAEELFCFYHMDLSPERFYHVYLDWIPYKNFRPLSPNSKGEGSHYHVNWNED